jgi:hypothetical protein
MTEPRFTDEPDVAYVDITVDTSRFDHAVELHRRAMRCVHCDHPQPTHGRRYAAIPGWHDWTPERRPAPYPGAAWLPPVISNQP